jgi:hypothetical protein
MPTNLENDHKDKEQKSNPNSLIEYANSEIDEIPESLKDKFEEIYSFADNMIYKDRNLPDYEANHYMTMLLKGQICSFFDETIAQLNTQQVNKLYEHMSKYRNQPEDKGPIEICLNTILSRQAHMRIERNKALNKVEELLSNIENGLSEKLEKAEEKFSEQREQGYDARVLLSTGIHNDVKSAFPLLDNPVPNESLLMLRGKSKLSKSFIDDTRNRIKQYKETGDVECFRGYNEKNKQGISYLKKNRFWAKAVLSIIAHISTLFIPAVYKSVKTKSIAQGACLFHTDAQSGQKASEAQNIINSVFNAGK